MVSSSNKDTRAMLKAARLADYIAWYPQDECFVNLGGNYDYLELPYYISQDLEAESVNVRPTCKEMLDAYVPPLFLEKARLAGLKVPEYYISNGYFEPPVVIDPINPFMIRSRVVLKKGREQSIAKSMTRNFTYAICCQEIPPGARVKYFRAVLGWTSVEAYRPLAQAVWEVFAIPVARVRIIENGDGPILISDISPLPFDRLGRRELRHVEEITQWRE